MIRLYVVTDSQVADTFVNKGHSRSEGLDELVERLGKQRDEIRVHTSWIPSADNVADTPSRDVLNQNAQGVVKKYSHRRRVPDLGKRQERQTYGSSNPHGWQTRLRLCTTTPGGS